MVEDIIIKENDSPITKIIKNCQTFYETSWKLENLAYPMLGMVSGGNPGVAKYILHKINPQKDQIISDLDILSKTPDGYAIKPSDPDFLEWWDSVKDTNKADEVFRR